MQNKLLLLCVTFEFVLIGVICDFIDEHDESEENKNFLSKDKHEMMRPISETKASKYWDHEMTNQRPKKENKKKTYNITEQIEKEVLRRTFRKLLKMIPELVHRNKTTKTSEIRRRASNTTWPPLDITTQSSSKKKDPKTGLLRLEVPPFDINPYGIEEDMHKLLANVKDVAEISVKVVGKTINRLDIVVLEIAQKKKESDKDKEKSKGKYVKVDQKKVIFLVHDLDSNYFTNSSVLTYMLNVYTGHLEHFDFMVMPMANTGGWSKNRRFVALSKDKTLNKKNNVPQGHCSGVNLERNFDIKWEKNHTISSCSDFYPGRRPFSEPESRAIRDILQSNYQRIIAYITVSAGRRNGVYYPKAHSASPPQNKYLEIKNSVMDRLSTHSNYTVMSVKFDSLYNAHGKYFGSSVDYASEVYGIPYAMKFQVVDFKNNLIYLKNFYRHVVDGVLFSIRDQEERTQ